MYEVEHIKGYEGKYTINTNGDVYSISRENAKGEFRIGKHLSPDTSSHGYARVRLFKGNTPSRVSVHRLVAEAFIPNPEGLPQVNHIDGNKLNNHIDNLEWCSASHNIRHSYDVLGKKKDNYCTGKFKERSHNHKAVLQYALDGSFIREYSTMVEASEVTGAQRSKITEVAKGRRKSAGGFNWKYKEVDEK